MSTWETVIRQGALGRFLGVGQPYDPVQRGSEQLRVLVRRLEIRARKALRTGLFGRYQSAFRGRGLEFEEVCEYKHGDDVRVIDWNVTARTGRLHVKHFHEERDLCMLLVVDSSASTLCGSGVMTVHDLITEVASLFALAASQRDRVGAVLFDEKVHRIIPPRSGWRHGLRVVREIVSCHPQGTQTGIKAAVQAVGGLLTRRGIVLLVLDHACELPRRELKALAARHIVVIIRAYDPLLLDGFSPAVLPVIDRESGQRGALVGAGEERHSEKMTNIDMISLRTDEDYLGAVRSLFEQRERRYAK